MCELCAHENENTILLEIKDIHIKPGAKFEASIEALTKAMGFDVQSMQKEISPFKSVRDLEDLSKKTVETRLLKLYHSIIKRWVTLEKASTDTFVLNGRIFIDPSSGKPLSDDEWKIIKKDILKSFDFIYASEEERIVLHAISLGKILKGLPLIDMVNSSYSTLKDRVTETMTQLENPEWAETVTFARQHAAEYMVDLKQRQYRKIHDTIQTSIINHENARDLKTTLFENFGEMNRDWRMVAETEIANAQNNGQLIAEMERTPEGETTFVRGISASEACSWCKNAVDGKVMAVLSEPPTGGDTVTVDGTEYTAIWPGKSNVGRNRKNWWVASGSQHPHCRCTWVGYIPGFEEVDQMFREAMEAAKAGYTGTIKYPQAGTTEKPVPWKP